MSKKEKLIERFNSIPRDFTFEELVSLMKYYGYKLDNAGKTSGSAVKFIKEGKMPYYLHKPHAYKCLLLYQIKGIKEYLKGENVK